MGQITVNKKLFIPKLHHIILTLLNPSNDVLKKFENEINKFLWLGKVHKVRKNTLILDYHHGCLKMVDYASFITLEATSI